MKTKLALAAVAAIALLYATRSELHQTWRSLSDDPEEAQQARDKRVREFLRQQAPQPQR